MASQLTDDERQALRGRYRAERDKRLRADGNNQYIESDLHRGILFRV